MFVILLDSHRQFPASAFWAATDDTDSDFDLTPPVRAAMQPVKSSLQLLLRFLGCMHIGMLFTDSCDHFREALAA